MLHQRISALLVLLVISTTFCLSENDQGYEEWHRKIFGNKIAGTSGLRNIFVTPCRSGFVKVNGICLPVMVESREDFDYEPRFLNNLKVSSKSKKETPQRT